LLLIGNLLHFCLHYSIWFL